MPSPRSLRDGAAARRAFVFALGVIAVASCGRSGLYYDESTLNGAGLSGSGGEGGAGSTGTATIGTNVGSGGSGSVTVGSGGSGPTTTVGSGGAGPTTTVGSGGSGASGSTTVGSGGSGTTTTVGVGVSTAVSTGVGTAVSSSSSGVGGGSSTSGVGGASTSSSTGVGGASTTGVTVSIASSSSGATSTVSSSAISSVAVATATATATSSSSSSSTSSTSASSGGPLEDCLNGLDDDGDGSVDCADADCMPGFSCVDPAPPGGWVGPIAIWEGNIGEVPPSCSSSGFFPTSLVQGFSGLSASPAVCPGCSCGSPVGVACQIGTSSYFGNGTCAGGAGGLNTAQGVCQAFITLSTDPLSVLWAGAPAAGGACIPQTNGTPSIPPIQWSDQVTACGDAPLTGGGCGADLCMPVPPSPFDQELCIYQAGDVACPVGIYSSKLLYFESATDTRTCTGCGCGNPTGLSCTGTLKVYSDTACSQDEVTLTSVGQCGGLSPDPTPPAPPYMSLRSVLYTGTSSGAGSCAPVASNTTGSVTPAQPVTLCCTP